MFTLRTSSLVLGLAAAAAAQPPQLAISIGIRETGAAGDVFNGIGAAGGVSGGIEWVNLDGQTLPVDGTWCQLKFSITTDPLTGFAGGTANGALDGTFGTLEHVRVRNTSGITDPIALWIDDVTNTTTTGGATRFGTFDGFSDGDEVMFQEPSFSGSTSANLMTTPDAAGVVNFVARSPSYRFDFQFLDNSTTRWVRLTTFKASNQPNPQIRFDDNSVVTFWMRAGDCQDDLGSQGPGNAISELCGEGLNTGEAATYHVGGAQANAPGALAVSAFGAPDLPLLGGNLVAGTGLLATVGIAADASGMLALPVPGSAVMTDLVLQSVLLDSSTPQNLGFTNAVRGRFGQ